MGEREVARERLERAARVASDPDPARALEGVRRIVAEAAVDEARNQLAEHGLPLDAESVADFAAWLMASVGAVLSADESETLRAVCLARAHEVERERAE